MKKIIFILICLSIFPCYTNAEPEFTKYKGDYFGQEPPGIQAEVFVHDLLANSINTIFSPDGTEFFFVKDMDGNNEGDILWMRQIDGKWTKPIAAPFNNELTDNDICISHDGKRVFFRSWRIIKGRTKEESASHIWYADKTEEGWSEAKLLEYEGGNLQAGYPSMAKNGRLYYPKRTNRINDFGELFYLKNKNGKFTESIALMNDSLNQYYEGDMCVAPDESFVITSCWNRPDSLKGGESDLYISFNLGNGKWSALKNMGETINTELIENCPTISPDGKYFFFMRYDGKNADAYWISSAYIEELK